MPAIARLPRAPRGHGRAPVYGVVLGIDEPARDARARSRARTDISNRCAPRGLEKPCAGHKRAARGASTKRGARGPDNHAPPQSRQQQANLHLAAHERGTPARRSQTREVPKAPEVNGSRRRARCFPNCLAQAESLPRRRVPLDPRPIGQRHVEAPVREPALPHATRAASVRNEQLRRELHAAPSELASAVKLEPLQNGRFVHGFTLLPAGASRGASFWYSISRR